METKTAYDDVKLTTLTALRSVDSVPPNEATYGYHHFVKFEFDEFGSNLLCRLYLHTGSIHPAHAFVAPVASLVEFIHHGNGVFHDTLTQFNTCLGSTKMQENWPLDVTTLRRNLSAGVNRAILA